jgi:hypothetical protein
MVGEILQARLDAPIMFAGDEDKAVSATDFAGELLRGLRRRAARIFLVHAVEHRQADRLRIDQRDVIPACAKTFDDELRQPDAHPVGAVGAVEHESAVFTANAFYDDISLE